MFRLLKSTLFCLIATLSLTTLVHAQSIPGISQPVTFQVDPQFPHPNTTVTVSAQSFSTDLNRATFTWTVNGKLYKKGTGIESITVPIGTTAMNISVDVATVDIGTVSNSVSVRPGSVDLVWETDGYTPPFYQGSAQEVYGSTFKVVALPELTGANGKRIDPKTLVYTWKKNDTVDANQSGYGKDSYTSTQSSYVRGGDTISVSVSDLANDVGATNVVGIGPTVPEILFYEDSPLYGIVYEHALPSTFNLNQQEITLRAEPYNMSSVNPLSGLLTYSWTLNGGGLADFQNKNEITLRTTGTTGGESDVALAVQHTTQVLQGGQATIKIFQ